jgi:hypothetical protein
VPSVWNSSRAPERPHSRSRSKPWWVSKCAKRISTRFLSSRDPESILNEGCAAMIVGLGVLRGEIVGLRGRSGHALH